MQISLPFFSKCLFLTMAFLFFFTAEGKAEACPSTPVHQQPEPALVPHSRSGRLPGWCRTCPGRRTRWIQLQPTATIQPAQGWWNTAQPTELRCTTFRTRQLFSRFKIDLCWGTFSSNCNFKLYTLTLGTVCKTGLQFGHLFHNANI